MSEKNLRDLDAKIAQEVSNARGDTKKSSHPSSYRPALDA